jgi:hypothetical protein
MRSARKRNETRERKMTNRHALSHLTFAVAAATLILVTASRAVELDPAAVTYVTPDQFKWRDNPVDPNVGVAVHASDGNGET